MSYVAKTKKRIYYKNYTVLEQSTVGANIFMVTLPELYEITVVAGGAGGAFNSSSNRSSAAAGGSGPGCVLRARLNGQPPGRMYSVNVGGGGVVNGGVDATATGGAGGDSWIKTGGVSLITAHGGIGGNVWWPNGQSQGAPAEKPTIAADNENFIVDKILFTEPGIPGAIGGSPSTGGRSVIEGTTYGQGGQAWNAGGGSRGEAGYAGYVKVILKKEVAEGEPYDDYEDTIKLHLVKTKVRTYTNKFTLPELTSNGVMGGETFACACSTPKDNVYLCFNNGSDWTGGVDTSPNAAPQWLSFYNPIPLKVTKLRLGQIKNTAEQNNYYITAWKVQTSDDNETWSDVWSGTATKPAQTLVADIEDSGYHKYYRVYIVSAQYYSGYPRVFFNGVDFEAEAEDAIFYDEVIESYVAKRQIRKYYKDGDYTKVGSPTFNKGIVSSFSQSNFITLPDLFSPGTNPWEIVIKSNFTSLSSAIQGVFISVASSSTAASSSIGTISAYGLQIHVKNNKVALFLSSTGNSWNLANSLQGTTPLVIGIDYWIKLVFTGNQYILYLSTTGAFSGEETVEVTVTTTTAIYPRYFLIGCNGSNFNEPIMGSIDLNESYIKIGDEYWWRGAYEVSASDVWDYYIDTEL